MEELDLLKKNWNKTNGFAQFSEAEIYKMLLKKSSSIVRLILIISIIELLFWLSTGMFMNTDSLFKKLNVSDLETYLIEFNCIHYIIIVGFIISFYRSYKQISVINSTKNLMNSILKTRKVVQYYIWYNLTIIAVSFVLGIVVFFSLDPDSSKLNQNINFKYGFIAGFTVVAILVIGVFWMLYKIIYGRLLKKLYSNYEDLKKIDC